jgi:hypothetical protein
MLVKLIAIMLLVALLLPMLGGIRRIRNLPKSGPSTDDTHDDAPQSPGGPDIRGE